VQSRDGTLARGSRPARSCITAKAGCAERRLELALHGWWRSPWRRFFAGRPPGLKAAHLAGCDSRPGDPLAAWSHRRETEALAVELEPRRFHPYRPSGRPFLSSRSATRYCVLASNWRNSRNRNRIRGVRVQMRGQAVAPVISGSSWAWPSRSLSFWRIRRSRQPARLYIPRSPSEQWPGCC